MNAPPLPPDPYRALGVESSADAGAIKTAYRKLVLKCHPDKFPDPTLKAQKQEEFQKVQQAYEILGDDDRRRDYDLEVKAKKLKEELAKRGGTASANPPAHSRYVNVNIRTADPPPGWSPSKHSTSKSSPYKPYSKEFSQSWEHEIPSRSKVYHEDERRARRTASYEKPKREDSRERRKREEDREREKRREREQRDHEEELMRKDIRRQQKLTKEREAAAREREREKERERKERRVREDRDAAKVKEAKKMRERESRRKQEADEKARAKSKPYLEHPPYSDEDDDVRRSRAKKSSSPKKQSDSPNRDKSTKQRERSNPLETVLGEEKYREKMAFAASYMEKIRSKTSKTSPRHTAEVPTWSAAYPDPNEKWAPKRRASGDGKYTKDEPIIVDAPEPDEAHPEVVSPSSNTKQVPPRLQKSHTMPTGYMPQTQTAAPVPPRVPLNRAFTMQPEHEYNRPTEKHRPAKKRASFDEDFQDYYQTRYHVSSRDSGVPRIDAKYRDPYTSAAGVTFSKVKTAPSYGAEHVATSRRYDEEDVMTSDYGHMQPQYYERTTAVR